MSLCVSSFPPVGCKTTCYFRIRTMNITQLKSILHSDVRSALERHAEEIGKINPRGYPMEIASVRDVFFNPIESDSIDIMRLISNAPIKLPLQGKITIMYKTNDGGAASKELEFYCSSMNATFDPTSGRFSIDFGEQFILTY